MKNRDHFRVVWKREGLKPKVKRYVIRKSAERMMNILTSPEPWKFYSEPKEADDYVCCPGGYMDQCGCMGVTVQQEAEHKYKDLPKIEWVRLETRTVTPWKSAGVEVHFTQRAAEPAGVPF